MSVEEPVSKARPYSKATMFILKRAALKKSTRLFFSW